MAGAGAGAGAGAATGAGGAAAGAGRRRARAAAKPSRPSRGPALPQRRLRRQAHHLGLNDLAVDHGRGAAPRVTVPPPNRDRAPDRCPRSAGTRGTRTAPGTRRRRRKRSAAPRRRRLARGGAGGPVSSARWAPRPARLVSHRRHPRSALLEPPSSIAVGAAAEPPPLVCVETRLSCRRCWAVAAGAGAGEPGRRPERRRARVPVPAFGRRRRRPPEAADGFADRLGLGSHVDRVMHDLGLDPWLHVGCGRTAVRLRGPAALREPMAKPARPPRPRTVAPAAI